MLSDALAVPALPDKTLVLTYDDGPGPNTVRIAEFLKSEGIPAAFFVVGKHVAAMRPVVGQVRAMGHLIGNHTYSHGRFRDDTSAAEIRAELSACHREIAEFVEEGRLFFRSPYGGWSATIAGHARQDAVLERYIGSVPWDIDGNDFRVGLRPSFFRAAYSFEECREAYLTQILEKGRGIVLLHDWSADPGSGGDRRRRNNRTAELTEWLVARLDGFRFKNLDEVDFPR